MPIEPEKILKQLVAATSEAKTTMRELHEARATMLDVDKKQRERITQLIVDEVTKQVGAIADEAKAELHKGVATVIEDIAGELRRRLLD